MLASSYQTIEIPLQTATFAAGANASVDFGPLQAQLAGRICHLAAIKFVVNYTPTLSSGTVTCEAAQKWVRTLTIKDGTGRQYFNGSFASQRLQDALERGALSVPEHDAAATTEAVNFCRVFKLAPDNFADSDDFVQPAAVFRGGNIIIGFGALTDGSANCTALTMTVQPYAVVQLHDELIMGSLVERVEQALTSGTAIGGEALYAHLGLAKSSAFATLSTGDLSAVQVIANGFTRDAINVSDLERMYHADMEVTGPTIVHGEPRAATDDNPKVFNGTALAAASAVLSPVIWSPQGVKLSKLVFHAMPNLVVKWTGSSSAYMLATRILPRTAADFGKAEALIRSALGVQIRSVEARTLSKSKYEGPRKAYLPLKCKVG